MDTDSKVQINAIQQAIKKLKSDYRNTMKENASLREEVERLNREINTMKEEEHVALSKLRATQIVEQIDKKNLSKEINRYIKMIDQCIAHIKTSL